MVEGAKLKFCRMINLSGGSDEKKNLQQNYYLKFLFNFHIEGARILQLIFFRIENENNHAYAIHET